MPGNKIGGQKAAKTNKANNPDFYKLIGAMGGSKGAKDGVVKGFAANHELARLAGAKGGKLSKRTSKK